MKPISKTAFYCCGVRMQDAESSNPVCGDIYARSFMNDEGRRILETFKDEVRPNSSNVARHRIIDDLLRAELRAKPDLRIVIIGAGFDSRAYRLKGGRWVELDEPQVIAYKNERLSPSACENELHRIPIDFSTDSLEEKLASFATTDSVVFVVEGVLMYLDEELIIQLLHTLRRLCPRHTLICDLMSRTFFEKYGRTIHQKIVGMGASFKFTAETPEKLLIENGYKLTRRVSITESAMEFESRKIPKIILRTFFRTLTEGYSIYVFETA
jgi:methyltransferase (TIGR00027 family)